MPKFNLVLLACLALHCSTIVADDEPKSKTLDHWVEYYKEVAKGYDMRLKSAPDEPLTVVAAPILVYSNPSSGRDTHGAFFVWTRHGRAEAIAAIWSKRTDAPVTSPRYVNHEFHSLANEPLVAKGTDGLKWAPETPGIELKLVPDAPIPAASRTLRLAQMREILRQFRGFDLYPQEGGSGQEVERELRVLPTPMYRYSETENQPASLDGAVFGFFLDWDPEILLVIEVRPTQDGPRWHYGVGRVDNKPLRLQFNKVDVWTKPENDFGSANNKYYCKFAVTTRPSEIK